MNLTKLSVGILWPLGNVSSFPESVGNSSNIPLMLPILEESMGGGESVLCASEV